MTQLSVSALASLHPNRRKAFFWIAFVAVFPLVNAQSLMAQTGTWNGSFGGLWSDSSRWSTIDFPDLSNGIPNAVINGGAVNVDQAIDLDDLTINGGNVIGINDITVNGSFNWTGGDMGTFAIGTTHVSSGTIDAGSGNVVNLRRNLSVGNGSMSWNDGDIGGFGIVNVNSGAGFYANGASGNDQTISTSLTVGASSGFISQSAATVFLNGAGFSSDGTVGSFGSGTIDISTTSGSGSASSQFGATSGSTIRFSGGNHSYLGSASGGGTFQFSGGTVAFSGGGYNASNTVVDGGTVGGDMQTQDLDWSAGAIDGTGTLDAQSGSIHGTGGLTLNQDLRKVSGGSISWLSNDISGTGKLTIDVGAFIAQGVAGNRVISSDVQINNGGGIQSVTTDTVSINGSQFINDGFIGSQNGGIIDISATSGSGGASGQFQISNGSEIRISGGTHNYAGDQNGGGKFRFTGGTTQFSGNYNVQQTQVESGGTVGGNMTTQDLLWSGGTIGGGGTLLTSGGTIDGSGGLTLNQTLQVTGGTANWFSNSISGSGDLKIVNGQLAAFGTSNRSIGTDVEIANSSAFQNISSGNTTFNGSSLTQNGFLSSSNNGTVTIATTTGSGAGDFQVDGGSTLRFSGGTHAYSGNISGSGNLEFTGGQTTLSGNNISGDSIFVGANGSLTLNGTSTSISANNLVNQGQLKIDGATLDTLGVGNFSNSGLVTLADMSTQMLSSNFSQSAGELRLVDGASAIMFSGNINGGALTGNGSLQGILQVGTGGTIAAGASAGIIDVASGSLQVDGTMLFEIGGSLLDGAAQNVAMVNSGLDYTTTQFDQINVYGSAQISNGATLSFSLINGFAPNVNHFFDIFTADTLTANLSNLNFNGPAGYLVNSQIVSLSDPGLGIRDALRVSFVAAVPEPGSAALFCIALACSSGRRRKKR